VDPAYHRSMSRFRVLAVTGVALAVVALGAGVTGLVVSPDSPQIVWLAVAAALSLPSLVLGLVIARRQPHNPVGALLAAVGLVVCNAAATDVYGAALQAQPGRLPTSDVMVSLMQGAWVWLYVPVALLLLFFPDGRLPSPRWRPVAVGVPLVAAAFTLLAAMAPGPYPDPWGRAPHALGTLGTWAGPLALALLPVVLALLIASAASMVGRFRRADEVARTQLKWFTFAGLSVPGTLLWCWASYLLIGGPDLVVVGLAVMYLAIPMATVIAMLRHDLYDVDRAMSATVTYGLVSTVLLGIFTLTSFLGGMVLGRGSAAATAAATAVCAVALVPLRDRLRRRVDRRLYPVRSAALDSVDELRRRSHLGEARPEQLEDVLRIALRDAGLQVGYRVPGRDGYEDASGAALSLDRRRQATPVLLGEQAIGVLSHSQPCPRALASEVADASSLLVEVVRLRLELRRAVLDVESSRSRLLHVGYDERRRLGRDLHDGAQQRLVSLGMALRLAQRHLQDGSIDLDDVFDHSVAELATAIAELRHLAYGLRPATLEEGLAPALADLAGRVPLVVDLDLGVVAVADDVSTTAYYVASEALANAVKHAAANRIGLLLTQDGAQLLVRITDDGMGGARIVPGTGLAGLGDRVAAFGGSLVVRSPAGGGTIVEATLPCAS
jgi:signal transduction histidine kinase